MDGRGIEVTGCQGGTDAGIHSSTQQHDRASFCGHHSRTPRLKALESITRLGRA